MANNTDRAGKLPHIGAIAERLVKEQELTPTQFANKMGVKIGTAKAYFARPTLQTEIVWRLCFALNYDFFGDIIDAYPADFKSRKDEKTAALEAEIADLKKENALMRELFKR